MVDICSGLGGGLWVDVIFFIFFVLFFVLLLLGPS